MDTSEKDKLPDSNNDDKSSVWGIFYLLVGIVGLAFSIFSGYYDFENIVPLFGTVIAGVLIAALSILMIIYGYRIMKRDI